MRTMIHRLAWALGGLAALSMPVAAQPDHSIERLAVQRALARLGGPRVLLSPYAAAAKQAPQDPAGGARREVAAGQSLAAALGATTAEFKDVLKCSAVPRECRLPAESVYVVLSDPVVSGTRAEVTVTVFYSAPPWVGVRTEYETHRYTFQLDTAGWTLVGVQELGIS